MKFSSVMLKKTALPIILVLLLGIVLWAFRLKKDVPDESKDAMLLTQIGAILEQKHFQPKAIDDKFSKLVFKTYLEQLNGDKDVFYQKDIDSLNKYEILLDDEIHGTIPISFYSEASTRYLNRVDEIMALYKDILSRPFDFTKDETVNLADSLATYPKTEAERRTMWEKRLKFYTLDRLTDMMDQRQKSPKDTSVSKTDAQLEVMARGKVEAMLNRTFKRQKLIYTADEQFNSYVNVITDLMDPHTEYFPPIEKRAFEEDLSGRFYGIGAQLKSEDDAIKIASLITGSPAWKSNQVQVNDEIVKVAQGTDEPVDVRGYDVTDVVKLIRGNKGTTVKLTLQKADGSSSVVSIVRDVIVQDEQFARSAVIKDGDKKYGYIFLPEFYIDFDRPDGNQCSQDVANEIVKLKKENISGIILDLRNNGGGSLPEVVKMVGLFIKQGPVVQVKDRNGQPQILKDDDSSVLYTGPLAVMVNELSASASEIFAAAIQDYKRGIIIGSTSTYGKGTVQRTLPLGKTLDVFTGQSEFGALKLTFEKFYRVSGGSTQLKGVVSDVILPDPYEYLKFREKDNPSSLGWDQLAKANYAAFPSNVDWSSVVAKANQRIAADSSFNVLKTNTEWLNNHVNDVHSLNLATYQKEQTLIKKAVKSDEEAVKLKTVMNIQPVSADSARYYSNADSAKGIRYQAWLKNIQKDLYIKETSSILNDIASYPAKN